MNLLIMEKSEALAKEFYKIAIKSNLFHHICYCDLDEDLSLKIQNENPQFIILPIEYTKNDTYQVLRTLTSHYKECIFLITGNMTDYPRILEALKGGAGNFILRPFTQISIYTALRNALYLLNFQSIKNDEESKTLEQNERTELVRIRAEKLLFSLINTKNDPLHIYRDLCSFCPEYAYYEQCRVGIIAAEHLPLDTMQDNKGISSSALTRLMNDLMGSVPAGFAISGVKSSGEISLFFFRDLPNIELQCHRLCQEVYRVTGISLHIGLGPAMNFPNDVQESANIARMYSKSYNLLGEAPSTITSCDPRYSTLPYDFSALEQDLYAALLMGNVSSIRRCAHNFCDTLLEFGYLCIRQMERIRLIYHGMRTSWIESFRVLYAEISKDLYSPAFVFRPPYDSNGTFSRELLEIGLIEDLTQVSRFILHLSSPSRLDKNYLQSVKEYIHHNYTQDLTQKQIARQFNVTPNYLSAAFKKKFGTTMLNYIHELRFRQAKKMLENPDISIIDISHAVGFADAKYFSRIFRQRENLSPREYRKKILHERNAPLDSL